MKFILDPRIFNYILIFLYLLSTIRWTVAGNYVQAFYWLCCIGITIAVSIMSKG